MSELKPCPFCLGTDLSSGGDDKYVGVYCKTCEAVGPNHYYNNYQWNTRHQPVHAAETVEACARIVEGAQAIASSSEAARDLECVAKAIRALPTAPSADVGLVDLLNDLQDAEANYRHCHDLYGGGDMKSGRAWDLMRRRGDAARSALAAKEPTK